MVKHEGGDPEGSSAGTIVLSSPGMFVKCKAYDSLCCCSPARRTVPSKFSGERMEHEQLPATQSDHPGGRNGQGRGDGARLSWQENVPTQHPPAADETLVMQRQGAAETFGEASLTVGVWVSIPTRLSCMGKMRP